MIVASRLEWGSGKTCRGVPSASARTTSSATADGAAASAHSSASLGSKLKDLYSGLQQLLKPKRVSWETLYGCRPIRVLERVHENP